MNKLTHTITAEQLLTIYYIACNSWKAKLKNYFLRIDLDNKINLSSNEVEQMFEAATTEQKQILNNIFPNKIDLSIINDTDWFYIHAHTFQWLAKGNILKENIEKTIRYCLTSGSLYTSKCTGFDINIIKVLRKATKEEIEDFYNKFPEYREEPLKWEDFGGLKGFYVSSSSSILNHIIRYSADDNKNTWPTREEAEAALALSQLCQWRDKYNQGWKPDWNNHDDKKYIIDVVSNIVQINYSYTIQNILAFKSAEIRDKFFDDFKDLIEIAKPLL
jgi:hypothetical protein